MGTTDDIDLQLSVTPTSGTRFAGQAPTPVRFKDIIVTVHGIGQQIRYSTVRYVATQLAASQALKGTSTHRPVAPQALGYFQLVIDPAAPAQRMAGAVAGFTCGRAVPVPVVARDARAGPRVRVASLHQAQRRA